MAINFLDNIQLNKNQLLGARIENVTSDPSTANGGDIIFNSTTGKLKYYDGTFPFSSAGWISLPDGTGVVGTGTVGTIPIWGPNTTTIDNSGLTVSGTGSAAILNIAYPFTALKTLHVQGDLKDVNDQTGTAGQLLSSLGSGNGIDWIDAPVSYTKWKANGASSTTQDVNDGDTYKPDESITRPGIFAELVTKSGTTITQPLGLFTKNMSLTSPGDYATDVLLWGQNANATSFKVNKTHIDDIPVSAWGQAATSVDMGDNLIIKVLDPVSAQDAATKAYVDGLVAGGVTVKGGFNASTGITAPAGTDLYTNTAITIGDYYIVTVAGNFFGQASTPLTPGDSVIALTTAASGSVVIANFAVIQSDTDLATATTVGIGNVNVSGAGSNDGLVLSSYTSGTAVIGVDIQNNASTFAAKNEMLFLVYDGGNTQNNLSLPIEAVAAYVNSADDFVGTSSNVTQHVFNHNLNSFQVNVQTYDTASKETVYASVDRTSVNQVIVTTASSASLTCVITKIG